MMTHALRTLALVSIATLAACSGSNSGAGNKTTTTATLPPLPPNVIAYVALAGSGGSVGTGSSMVEATVSPAPVSVGTRVRVGSYPDAVAIAPGGRLALVVNYNSNSVTPVVLPSNKVLPANPRRCPASAW